MIRLKDLILESKASEKAKKLGLKHTSFGRYADSSGKVVARSVKGELVPVKGHEGKEKIKRPNAQNVYKNHKQGKAIYRRSAAEKKQRELQKEVFGDENGREKVLSTLHPDEEAEVIEYFPRMKSRPGPHFSGWKKINPPQLEWRELSASPATEYWGVDGRVQSPLMAKHYKEFVRNRKMQAETAQKNRAGAIEWRLKQPMGLQLDMLKIQDKWQSTAQSRVSIYDRIDRNDTINTFFEDKGTPPKIKVKDHLERGMTIPTSEIEEFLSNFKVGENVVMPPSGYSADSKIARDFAQPQERTLGDGPGGQVSVILRVKPKRAGGEVIGLPLHGRNEYVAMYRDEKKNPWRKKFNEVRELEKERKRKAEEEGKKYVPLKDKRGHPVVSTLGAWLRMFQEYRSSNFNGMKWENDGYESEFEVMRSGNVSQKVLSIQKKVVYWNHSKARKDVGKDISGLSQYQFQDQFQDHAQVIYIIEMEDGEMVDDPDLIEEAKLTKASESAKKLLRKYVEGPIKSVKSKKDKILQKYMNTNVRGQ